MGIRIEFQYKLVIKQKVGFKLFCPHLLLEVFSSACSDLLALPPPQHRIDPNRRRLALKNYKDTYKRVDLELI